VKRVPKIRFADDEKFSIRVLGLMRTPPLLIGLVLGFLMSLATSRFEEVLSKHVQVAFFIPFIVYMADAVGTQTQTIYIRDLTRGKAHFFTYLVKEGVLGILLGLLFGLLSFIATIVFFHWMLLALAVGISMFVAISTAPVINIIIVELLELEHQDPAMGSGPIATVIQDAISVIMYGIIASAIIL
jgi:magnesium transporter